MNDTSATASQSGASLLPDGIGAITAVHMVFMLLVAIAAIAIIIVGIRRKRIRTQAERQVKINAREAGMTPSTGDAKPALEPAPVVEAPSPPPAPAPIPAPTPAPAPAPVVAIPVEPVAPPPPPAEPVAEPIPEPAPLTDEPIAAAAPLAAAPASVAADTPPAPMATPMADPVPAPAPTPAPVDAIDPADTPVTQLKGLGPKLATRLATHGITTVGDLAALSEQQAEALDAQLGPFTGRMTRDRWLEQARLLAAGDRAGFEAVFGRL